MAAIFGSSYDCLYANGTVNGVNVDTLTFSAHYRFDGVAAGGDGWRALIVTCVPEIGPGQSAFGLAWAMQNVAGTGYPQIFANFSGGAGIWRASSNPMSLGQWYQAVLKMDLSSASNDPRMWIDGVEVTLTELNAPSGTRVGTLDSVGIQADQALNANEYAASAFEHCAVWAVNLTDDECVAVSKGFSPLLVTRPKFYAPLISNARDLIQGVTLTDNGATTFGAGYRVLAPSRALVGVPVAATVAEVEQTDRRTIVLRPLDATPQNIVLRPTPATVAPSTPIYLYQGEAVATDVVLRDPKVLQASDGSIHATLTVTEAADTLSATATLAGASTPIVVGGGGRVTTYKKQDLAPAPITAASMILELDDVVASTATLGIDYESEIEFLLLAA